MIETYYSLLLAFYFMIFFFYIHTFFELKFWKITLFIQ